MELFISCASGPSLAFFFSLLFKYTRPILTIPILCCVLLNAVAGQSAATEVPRSSLLTHALVLADLNNWAEAESEFRKAEMVFQHNGDQRNLAYAKLGLIRATIQQRNLPLTSAELARYLQTDPLFQSDLHLRLFCWAIKADVDSEMQSSVMKRDWAEVDKLARQVGDKKWQYRALAGFGLAAFYGGDLETARKNVTTALLAATEIHDVGSQVKCLYAIGLGLSSAQMYTEALEYFDKAILLSQVTAGVLLRSLIGART